MAETPRNVIVVPHTHWDREWYKPYQTFRMKLIELVDELIELLERDPSFAHFQLDGQMAVVDDYLEVRPEARERIARLASAGRLSMGPWYILPDEFLVSGETLVRDLQLGLRTAARFGGAMDVGYLPDMFGHIAQMPQILRLGGFSTGVVWRGVPAAVDRTAFWWEAPDGSTVRTEYLLDGYGNGAHLPRDAESLIAAIERYTNRFASFRRDGEPLLWMNGTDHLAPQPWLGRLLDDANDLEPGLSLRVGSLSDYLAIAPTTGLPTQVGELRSGARANLLMGVASNRTDVRQAAATAERSLERVAEPLAALLGDPDEWPERLLELAWLEMIRNSAHDSICACSVDGVGRAVLARYDEATDIAEGIIDRSLRGLGASLAQAGTVIVNPAARARSGLVEMRLDGREPVAGTQLLGHRGGEVSSEGITRANAAILTQTALDAMPELASSSARICDDGTLEVRLVRGPGGDASDGASVRDTVLSAATDDPDGPARLTVMMPEAQKVLAWTGAVEGFGWKLWDAQVPDQVAVEVTEANGGVAITNGIAEVVVDPDTGTFALDGVAGFGRLVDGGDTGDTYNYNRPTEDSIVDTPEDVAIRVVERGPLRARVEIDRTYVWPTHAEGDRRTGSTEVETSTTIEVRIGSPLIGITVELDNPSKDHRLRAHLPLPEPADRSVAECAFGPVQRPTVAEGGPTEEPLATSPSRRFVCAGGLTVLHDGLPEYELVDLDAHDRACGLALTLLRCTGVISQGPMRSRPLPAGPMVATADAQMPGHQVSRFAVATGDDPQRAYVFADEAFTPLQVARATGQGDRDASGSALQVTSSGAPGSVEVSSVQRVAGAIELRVFNTTSEPITVTISKRRGWVIDLRGKPITAFDGELELGPHAIATARLDR